MGLINAEILLRDQFVEQFLDGALRRELKQMVRRQPGATLFQVRCEAIRWEPESFTGGVRGRSHSVPSAFGLQYGVLGSREATTPPRGSEMTELREMLRQQQEQLNQLTHSISALQGSRPHRPVHRGPVVCSQCPQPGHYASECDGVWVSNRTTSSLPASRPSRQSQPSQPSEN